MYTLRNFGDMISDIGRFKAYEKAIVKAVRPGDTVLEIGCGPGVFAFLACRAGARRVYAIETEDIVGLAKEMSAANGFADRIEFFQGDSRKTDLPERVNVIVSDLRGVLPLFDHAIPSIEDARKRFLVPGGIMIPQRDILKASVIQADEFYSELTSPWLESAPEFELTAALSSVLNAFHSARFKDAQVLAAPQTWSVADYTREVSARAAGEIAFCVTRSGVGHGLCLWFDTVLFGDIGFSSGPSADAKIYSQLFLPWLEPAPVKEGQQILIKLRADLIGKDYVWRWETEISPPDGSPKIHFRQSTFEGANFSSQTLRRHATNHVPVLTQEGQADLFLLQAMDGSASLQRIAEKVSERFPELYPRWNDAFERAVELSRRFAR